MIANVDSFSFQKTIKYTFLSLFIFILFTDCQPEKRKLKPSDHLINGTVVVVFDGDTYQLLTEDQKIIKVRMEGIDAPEREMPYHHASRQYLKKLIHKKEILLKKTGEDTFGRAIGYTYLKDSTDINLEMLSAGMVWHFKRYNKDPRYADAEQEARKMEIGIWHDKNPIAPWVYRNQKRTLHGY